MIRNTLIALVCLGTAVALAQNSDSANGNTPPADQMKSAAQTMSQRASDTVQQIHDNGIPPGTMMAWIVVGALAGIVTGAFFHKTAQGPGMFVNLVIGGLGAFIGGFIVRVVGIDFGWPTISFKPEGMLLAIIFSFVLVFLYRGVLRKVHHATAPKGETTEVKS